MKRWEYVQVVFEGIETKGKNNLHWSWYLMIFDYLRKAFSAFLWACCEETSRSRFEHLFFAVHNELDFTQLHSSICIRKTCTDPFLARECGSRLYCIICACRLFAGPSIAGTMWTSAMARGSSSTTWMRTRNPLGSKIEPRLYFHIHVSIHDMNFSAPN